MSAILLHFAARLHHPRISKGGIKASLTNIWYKSERLFFQFTLRNASEIPFDLQFVKYYIRDNHRSKRTAIMEREIIPEYTVMSSGDRCEVNATSTLVFVFAKFTIADSKHLSVEFFEKNGDRHIQLAIKGKRLLKTRSLP